jgi:hypothetical protein
VQCFAQYFHGTVAAKIWLVQIQNLKSVGWFFKENFFVYFMIAIWFIALAYFCFRPTEQFQLSSELAKKLKKKALGATSKSKD